MNIAMPLIAGFSLFFSALIYLVMAVKINKRGTLLLMALVFGLVYTVMGVPIMLLYFGIAGLVGEAVLLKGDGSQYRSLKRQAVAFAAFGAIFGSGANIVLYLYGADYLKDMYSPVMLERMIYFAYSVTWNVVGTLFSFLMAILGSWFASKLLHKHFIKAGMLK